MSGRVVGIVETSWRQTFFGCSSGGPEGPAVDQVYFGYTERDEAGSPMIIITSAMPGRLDSIELLITDPYLNAGGSSASAPLPDVPEDLPRRELEAFLGFRRAHMIGPASFRMSGDQVGTTDEAWLVTLRSADTDVAIASWGLPRSSVLDLVEHLTDIQGNIQALDWIDEQAELDSRSS